MEGQLSLENRENLIRPGERLDDLQFGGMKILQKLDGFRFGTDAVLLSGFVRARGRDRILDMGCGTGVIGLLLAGRLPLADITGLELQSDMAEMAQRSAEINGLTDRMRIVQGDLRRCDEIFAPCSFDVVVMNPPYSPLGSGPVSETDAHALARHEATCTARDMAHAAFRLLKNGGKLFVIYPAERIYEVMDACIQERMTPKRLRLIQHSAGRAPKLLLMEASRQGKSGVMWMEPLILCEADGSYTPEARRIYHQQEE